MMKRKYAILTLLLSLCTAGWAAEPDTVSQIRVADHLLTGLYRTPHADAFRSGPLSNLELSFYWNPGVLAVPMSGRSYAWDPLSLGLSLSKEFSRTHALRLGFDFSVPSMQEQYQAYKFKRYQFDLGWVWNATNYFGGYDLSRKHHALATLGFFYGKTDLKQEYSGGDGYAGGWLGMQYRYVISPRISLFTEAQMRMANREYGGYVDSRVNADGKPELLTDNEKDLATTISLMLGANVRLTNSLYRVNESERDSRGLKVIDNLFARVGGGISRVGGQTVPNIDVFLGKWVNSKFGVGIGAHDNFRMQGGRAEVIINPVALFSGEASKGLWDFDISAGAEAGSIKLDNVLGLQDKYGNVEVDKAFYMGPTLAGQLKFYLSPWTALFLEGRYTMAQADFNNESSRSLAGQSVEERENTATFNLGVETFHTNFSRFTGTRKPKRVGQDLRDTWWLEFAGKVQRLSTSNPNHKLSNGGFSFAVGRHFSNSSALRARLELQSMNQAEIDSIVGYTLEKQYSYDDDGNMYEWYKATPVKDAVKLMPMLSVDYVYNLTNSWMGVNPERHFDLNFIGGMVFAYEGMEQFDMGYEAGLQLSHRLSPNWNIYLEPYYQWLYRIDQFHGRWNLGGGARYTFVKRSRPAWLDRSRWFLQVLGGAQFLSYDMKKSESVSTLKSVFSSGDEGHGLKHMNMEIALGRHMDPVWGFRGSVFAQEFKVKEGVGPAVQDETTMQLWGLRAEAFYDLWRSFSPKLERSRWNIVTMAGVEAGRFLPESKAFEDGSKHFIFGLTAAAQLQYRITNNGWIVGETRGQVLNVNDPNLVMTASLGAQYDLYYRKRSDLTSRVKNRWYFGGGVGMMDGHVGSFEFFAGDNFNAIHGLRLGLTLTDNPMLNVANASGTMNMDHYASLGIDYTYHLSNRIWGVDPERYIDFQLLAGLEMGMTSMQDFSRTSDWNTLKFYPGFNLGAHVTGHIAGGLSWYVEPRLSCLFKDNPMTSYEAEDLNEKMNLFSMVGLQFELNPYKRAYKWVENPAKNYVAAKLIVQPMVYQDRFFKEGGGIGAELTYGRWWNDFIGTEATGMIYSFKMFSKKQELYGGRLDFTADLTACMNPDWRRKPFQLVGLIGVAAGMYTAEWDWADFTEGRGTDYREYRYRNGEGYLGNGHSTGEKKFTVGPALGLDLRWRHRGTAPVGLSLGTRVSSFKYDVPYNAAGDTDSQTFMPVSFDLGIHYNF